MERGKPKSVEWVGSSKDDLKEFPEEVKDHIGYALFLAQIGSKHRDVKPLSGMSAGIMEVVSRFDKDTYRVVYTVRFPESVYVLHAFQKKSKRGLSTPKREIELVRQRLRSAEQHYKTKYGG